MRRLNRIHRSDWYVRTRMVWAVWQAERIVAAMTEAERAEMFVVGGPDVARP